MEYKVITVESSEYDGGTCKLQKEVNQLCREGWKPQGSMSVSEFDDDNALLFKHKYRFSQPMVK